MSTPSPRRSEAEKQVKALHPRRPGFRREEARQWLKAHPEEAMPPLLGAVEDASLSVSAIRLLGELGSDEAVPALLKVLRGTTPRRVHEAGIALAQLDDGVGFDAVRRVLPELKEPGLSGALVTLARSGDPSDCARVTPYMEHESEGVRHRAKLAIDALGCPP